MSRCASSPLGCRDTRHLAVGIEHDLALGQIEVERLAQGAAALERGIGLPQRRQHRLEQRRGGGIRRAVDRGLRLLVGELGARAHHDPVQRMAQLPAVRVDHHSHREGRPVLGLAQRAQVVGDALGQHRHDAIGEIDRVAALQRLAVERRAGGNVGGDVGDGDGEYEAARVHRVGIGRCVDGVVVVLCVGRVDGDQRQVAKILAAGHCRGARGLGRGQRLRLEDGGNLMRVDGDQTDRLLAGVGADALRHLGRRQAEARALQDVDRDEIAVLRLALVALAYEQRAPVGGFLVDGEHLATRAGLRTRAKNAEHLGFPAREQLDDAAGVGRRIVTQILAGGVADRLGAHQRAIAEAGVRRAGALLARHVEDDGGRAAVRLVPVDRLGEQVAVAVAGEDLGDDGGGQGAGLGQAFSPSLDDAFFLHLLQDSFEADLVGTLELEGAGDLALADLRRRALASRLALAGDERDDLFARREGGRGFLCHEARPPFSRLREKVARRSRVG